MDKILSEMLGWSVGWPEIVLIVIAILVLFGGRKLPELARGLGRGLREFRRELKGVRKDVEDSANVDESADEDATPPGTGD